MNRTRNYRPRLECLEDRWTPAIRLDLVTLHELGHALGLAHTNNVGSIMDPYYNANYNLNNFSNDPAVATFRSLFNNVDTSSWKDNLDGADDGKVTISYSFMLDGTKAENNRNNEIFSRFNSTFGNQSTWQNIIRGELNRWAAVSNNKVNFREVADTAGLKFGVSGAAQNDPRFGDIRIAAHRFDGSGKTLAHTYYPPPNGGTAAGDMHFDFAEAWIGGGNGPNSFLLPGGNSGILFDDLGTGQGHHHEDELDVSLAGVGLALVPPSPVQLADAIFSIQPDFVKSETFADALIPNPDRMESSASSDTASVADNRSTSDHASEAMPLSLLGPVNLSDLDSL